MTNCLGVYVRELEELAQGADPSAYSPVDQIIREGETAIMILRQQGAEIDSGLRGRFHNLTDRFATAVGSR